MPARAPLSTSAYFTHSSRVWAEQPILAEIDTPPPSARRVRLHKHMKSTNMLKQLNQEIKRRTHGVRNFPNAKIERSTDG
jgi:Transposase, Mutator family